LVRLPGLVELLRPRDIAAAGAVAAAAGVAAGDEAELKAADAGPDVDVVVVELAMAYRVSAGDIRTNLKFTGCYP
jgi:hypothetical protein